MKSIYDNLSPKQLEAVRHGQGPLLIVACPGSGKTRVLTHRIAHLISLGIAPHRILATTFTNKAADEMKERVGKLVGPSAERVWIGTVHSTCGRLIRSCGAQRVGLKDNKFTVYTESRSEALVKQIIYDLKTVTELTPSAVHSHITEAKEKGFHADEFAAEHKVGSEIYPIYNEYNKRLRESNAVDFGDLQLLAVDMLERESKVLEIVQNRFLYVLVDEYQDTNEIQARLFKLIAGKNRNISVVGDLDQSIYSFRYAEPENIRNFATDDWFGAKTIYLDTNYRSTPSIISASASVIQENTGRFELDFKPSRPDGAPVVICRLPDEDKEASAAAQIAMAHYGRGVPLPEIAILYRFHRSSRAIERVFRQRGIPYKIVGGTAFYDRQEIADLLAWLGILVNPNDASAFERAAKVPPRGVGKTTIAAILRYAADHKLLPIQAAAKCKVSPKQRAGLDQMVELYNQFYAQADDPNLVYNIAEATGYFEWWQNKKEKDETVENRLANIEELVTSYYKYSSQVLKVRALGVESVADDEIDVSRFLPDDSSEEVPSALELFMQQVVIAKTDEGDTDDAVRFSTIHAAKGTEFRVVIVIGCDQGTLPPQRTIDMAKYESDPMEEERRICYVAMTRAKDFLYLFHPHEVLRFDKSGPYTETRPASEFLTSAMAGGAVRVGSLDLPRPLPVGPIKVKDRRTR